jgi:hypothetical protein
MRQDHEQKERNVRITDSSLIRAIGIVKRAPGLLSFRQSNNSNNNNLNKILLITSPETQQKQGNQLPFDCVVERLACFCFTDTNSHSLETSH